MSNMCGDFLFKSSTCKLGQYRLSSVSAIAAMHFLPLRLNFACLQNHMAVNKLTQKVPLVGLSAETQDKKKNVTQKRHHHKLLIGSTRFCDRSVYWVLCTCVPIKLPCVIGSACLHGRLQTPNGVFASLTLKVKVCQGDPVTPVAWGCKHSPNSPQRIARSLGHKSPLG